LLGVLNDDYEGGEFIMFDDYEIKFKAGDLIIFPSIFLYPHLVKPVKKEQDIHLYLGVINEKTYNK
jgi:predicted 2-oxoglutarate/Fe(II)-dependent dioxygenase YbiX